MTLKEFFRRARRKKWRVVGGYVECRKGYCPLGAVARIPAGYFPGIVEMPSPYEAAAKLGLPVSTARKIANAADKPLSRNRKWLLKNLGVRA